MPDSDFELMMSDIGFVQDNCNLEVPEQCLESEEDILEDLMDEDWRTNSE